MARYRRRFRENFGTVQFTDDGQPIGFTPHPDSGRSVAFRLRDYGTLQDLDRQRFVSPEDMERARQWFIQERARQ